MPSPRLLCAVGTWLALAAACSVFSSLDDYKGAGAVGPEAGGTSNKDTGWVDVSCFGSCSVPNAVLTSCVDNRCVIDACAKDFEDCDGKPENGCEANLLTDPATCGSCSKACQAPNGTPLCTAGECGIQCDEGAEDCNTNLVDGCEAVPDFDGSNCGGCNVKCQFGTACANGVCVQSNCPSTNGTLIALPVADSETGLWSAVPDKPHFAQVDEPGENDGLATYIWDDTEISQSRALFEHSVVDVPPSVSISALVVSAQAALADNATVPTNLWLTLRLGTSLYDSSLQQVPSKTFQAYVRDFPQNPMTQSPWQSSDLGSIVFGVTHKKPIAATNALRVTQVVLEVCVVP